MKTLTSILLSCLFLISNAQEDKYELAMTNTLKKLNQATMGDDFLNAANTFERISMNEKKEWLPLYYAAFSYIIVTYSLPDNSPKDAYLDKAQYFLDKAFEIEANESELYALQAFLYPARISVSPMERGAEYMEKMNRTLDKAIELNAENPRSYYLRAIITLNLPEAFGGGAAKAKPIFELAKEKFDTFQPQTTISPNWGKEQNEEELKNCETVTK